MRPVPARYGHVLVTGASAGIGTAFAEALAPRARRLTLVARRAERLQQLAATLRARHPALEVVVEPLDLFDPAAPALLVERLAGAPDLDLLVNNAGFGKHRPWGDVPWPVYREMLQLNVVALAELTHRFWPVLTAVPGRGVIQVASTAGFQPIPWFAAYGATKAFVRSLGNALAYEGRRTGTRVLSFCPGPVPTEFGAVAEAAPKVAKRSLSAEKVVRIALAAYDRGRSEVIAGWQNRVLAVLASRLPLRWTLALAARVADRRADA